MKAFAPSGGSFLLFLSRNLTAPLARYLTVPRCETGGSSRRGTWRNQPGRRRLRLPGIKENTGAEGYFLLFEKSGSEGLAKTVKKRMISLKKIIRWAACLISTSFLRTGIPSPAGFWASAPVPAWSAENQRPPVSKKEPIPRNSSFGAPCRF